MTVIVGLVHHGAVHIGGDSAGVAGYDLTIRADHKVFANGPYLFGFTSSFRMGQLIRFALTPPEPHGDLDRFMVTEFIDAIRDCLKAGGFAKKDNEQEEGGCFLVGIQGRLFKVDDDYQVGESLDGYTAAGCGEATALGALYATTDRMAPTRRVEIALKAAERFSAGVRGPFIIRSLPALAAPAPAAEPEPASTAELSSTAEPAAAETATASTAAAESAAAEH